MRGVIRLLIGCFLVVLLGSTVCVQVSFAQGDPPLNFAQNYFVRGGYVVAGAYGMTSSFTFINGNEYAIGTIVIPDVNPGITGPKLVPPGGEPIAAMLYWQTVEKVGVEPGQPGSGQDGYILPVIEGGPAPPGYPITGVALTSGGSNAVSWSGGGCTGSSTGKVVRTYRANVLNALPRDSMGNILANGIYEVLLPGTTSTTPIAVGASLVVVYRVLDPTVPYESIVFFDGDFAPTNTSLTMTEPMWGFYDAATTEKNSAYSLTHIVGNGKSNKYETVYLDNVALSSLYGHNHPAFPGYYGTWDIAQWTFGPNSNLVAEHAASVTTKVVPSSSQQGCVAWGAVIFSTTIHNTDGDGLPDAVKKTPVGYPNPGYCDAAINEGVCTPGSSSWVDLPGAVLGTPQNPHPDVYVQYDYMCSSPNPDGNTCVTGDGTNYSFNPMLQKTGGMSAVDMVTAVYAAHGITLHVVNEQEGNQPNVHAIQETVCQDTMVNGQLSLCAFPHPSSPEGNTINLGVVTWPGGVTGFERQLIDPANPTSLGLCTTSPPAAACVPRFQPGAAPFKHYGLFAHAVGQPKWNIYNGTLASVKQTGNTVTFTTSTPVGPLNVLGPDASGHTALDPSCPYGRVYVAGAVTNTNLDGPFCVNSPGPQGDSFTITVGGSPLKLSYTRGTDPNLAVAPPYTSTQSGIADVGGHHFVGSLGLWGNPASPTSDGQNPSVIASTLAHEQGHAIFSFAHGGPAAGALANPPLFRSVTTNCKVNYLSVMSYSRQLDLLDYSESALPDIDKETQTGSLPGVTAITHWYVPWPAARDSSGNPIGSASTHLCSGAPVPGGETAMTRVTGPADTFSWTSLSGTNTDINFDDNPDENFLGAWDWGNYDLAQTDATGSYLSSSGPPFGGGGPPFGGGGPPFGGGGPPFGGGGPPFGGGGPPFGGGGPPFGGGGEIDLETAQSITAVPQNLTATENASPRTITLNWTKPFGDIGAYNIYRSADGGKTFTKIYTVTGTPPATTYTDTVTCNPTGYQYFVTAVQSATSTNPGAESTPSNIVSTGSDGPLTGCYTNTPPTVTLNNLSFTPTTLVQGSSVPLTWSLQDDYNTMGAYVNNLAANSLVAIGPLNNDQGCPASPPAGTPTIPLLLKGVVQDGVSTFGVSAASPYVFTFNWNTTNSLAGCYFFMLTLDSTQTETTTSPLTLLIYVSDSSPHVTTTTLPPGVVESAYSNTIFEAGGVSPFNWAVISGSLPNGITLGMATGTVSGTACVAGSYNFTVKVTDKNSNYGTQALTLQINKTDTTTVVAPTANPSVFQQMVTFTVTVAPQSPCTPTGTVTLFDGVNAIASNLTLSGGMATFTTSALSVGMHNITASYSGDSNYNATGSDAGSTATTLIQTVNKASTQITINSVLPSPATVGLPTTVAYSFGVVSPGAGAPIPPSGSLMVTGSDGSSCMPAPAAILGSGACVLYPITAGTTTFTVSYPGDGNFVSSGANGNDTVNIYASDAAPPATPPFPLPTTTLPNGVVGSPYSNTVYESGGVTTGQNNFSWTIVSGSVMPGGGSTLPGLSFQANAAGVTNGTLSGTPTQPGAYTFTAMVTDSVGNTGTQTLTLIVLSGDLIVVDGSPSAKPLVGTILRITPGGTSSTVANILNGSPTGVAVDPNTGNIYAAVAVPPVGSGSPSIVKVTEAGMLSTFALGGVFQNPVAVAVDTSGNVYVADNSTHAIYKFNTSGTQVDANGNATVNPFALLPSSPSPNDIRMAFDSSGNLDVASDGLTVGPVEVDQIAHNGTLTVLYNTTNSNLSPSIGTVGGIALFSDGSIDVADYVAEAIYKITNPGAANMMTSTAVSSAALCCNISGMANRLSQVNTTLYVSLNSAVQLLLAVPETSSVTTVLSGTPLTFPNDVAWYDFPALPPQGPPPQPATSLMVSSVMPAMSVSLTWMASPSTTVGYNVYRGTTSGGPYAPIGSAATTSFTDTTVTSGTTYYYVVTAVGPNSLESVFSNEVYATP